MVSINNLQSEMNEGSFNKIDNMWMLNEEDAWTHLQASVKSLSNFVSQLEENVNNSYDEMFHKINGLGKFMMQMQRHIQNFIKHLSRNFLRKYVRAYSY